MEQAKRTVLHLRSSGALLGAERVILSLARHSPGLGWRPVLAAIVDDGDPTPDLLRVAARQGVEVVALPCRGRLDPLLPFRLRRILRRLRVDLIHTHGYKEDIATALAGPHLPWVATNHLWKRTSARLRLYSRLDAFCLRWFDALVAVSAPILSDMRRLGLPPGRMRVIANGIDVEGFDPEPPETVRRAVRAEFNLPAEALLLGSVGSLTRVKGHAVLLAALPGLAARYPSLRWLVVGDGPERAALAEAAERLGVAGRLTLAGRREDVPRLLGALDVFVLPSLAEGLPIALLEAMAAGRPVVATAVGEVGGVLAAGGGRVVPPGDGAALADSLDELLSDPVSRQACGRTARQVVAERYSAQAMTASYCELYEHLLDGGARPGHRPAVSRRRGAG